RGRNASEKPGSHSPHGARSRRSGQDRGELPRRSTGPEGPHIRSETRPRDWQLCCFATFHETRDSTWLSQRGRVGELFPRRPWYLLAPVLYSEDGSRRNVSG